MRGFVWRLKGIYGCVGGVAARIVKRCIYTDPSLFTQKKEVSFDDVFVTAPYIENRYKHEAMVNGEPVLFEILDSCPKVSFMIFLIIYSRSIERRYVLKDRFLYIYLVNIIQG